jgi:hypothetical protein
MSLCSIYQQGRTTGMVWYGFRFRAHGWQQPARLVRVVRPSFPFPYFSPGAATFSVSGLVWVRVCLSRSEFGARTSTEMAPGHFVIASTAG